MSKIFLTIVLLFMYSCELQPNRPLIALDRINKLKIKPSNSPTPEPIISTTPSYNNKPVENTDISKIIFKGQIFDIKTNKPLEMVNISINNLKIQTDINGNFSVPDLPIGIYEFIATKDGYLDYLSDITLNKDFGRILIYMRRKL
jgi:hypothetical protein